MDDKGALVVRMFLGSMAPGSCKPDSCRRRCTPVCIPLETHAVPRREERTGVCKTRSHQTRRRRPQTRDQDDATLISGPALARKRMQARDFSSGSGPGTGVAMRAWEADGVRCKYVPRQRAAVFGVVAEFYRAGVSDGPRASAAGMAPGRVSVSVTCDAPGRSRAWSPTGQRC